MSVIVHLRFDEHDVAERPRDLIGSVGELEAPAGVTAPSVIEGATGFARLFAPDSENGLVAVDVDAGATLLNRDLTIQAILRYDFDVAIADGNPGAIVSRGLGDTLEERQPFGLELVVVNAGARIGGVRFVWQTAAGVAKEQVAAHFAIDDGAWVLLTATRRWVSPTEVVCRYYLADELLAEVISVDGDIGGGTPGDLSIGMRAIGGVYARFLAGAIDEIRILDEELSLEEIGATWHRISVSQPRGVMLVKELTPPGMPISDDPGSRVQREVRLWGNALGYADAQAEDLRRNNVPTRAYGATLEGWETVVRTPARRGDSLDRRRARVVAHERQANDLAVDTVTGALAELADTAPGNLEVLSFSPTVTEDFTPIVDPLVWDNTSWSSDGTQARYQPPIGSYHLTTAPAGGTEQLLRAWVPCFTNLGGNGKFAQMIAKLIPTSLPNNGEAGIVFADRARGNLILLGVRNVAGDLKVFREVLKGWRSVGGAVELATVAAGNIWLHLGADTDGDSFFGGDEDVEFRVGWSTTSGVAGFTYVDGIVTVERHEWAGFYFRTNGVAGIAGAGDVRFDDITIRSPYGSRAFRWYVYRDPSLPGAPDTIGANATMRSQQHAHTAGAFITTKIAKADSADTQLDITPMGAI